MMHGQTKITLSSYLFSRSFIDDVLHYEHTTVEYDQFPDVF